MPFIPLLFTLILHVKADTEIQNVGTASNDGGSYQKLTDESFASYATENVYSGYFLVFSKTSDKDHEKIKAIVDATAKSAKFRGLITSFALIDAVDGVKTIEDFGIKRYPSWIHVRDGKRTPYNGKIGVTPLLKHLVKVELTKVYDIDSETTLSMFKRPYNEGHHPYVVAEFSDTKESMQESVAYKSLVTAAKQGEVPIAAIHGRTANQISIYTEGRDGAMAVSVYTGAVDIPDAIDAWIMTAKVPPITFLNPDNARTVLRRHFTRAVVLALDHGEILSLGHTNTGVVKAFREVGFQYQRGGSMSPKFLVIDLQDGFCRRFMNHYHGGFELSSHSILFSEGTGKEYTRYLLKPADTEGAYTSEEIYAFVKKAIKGELQEFRLSQPVPDNDNGDVAKAIVRDNFQPKVINAPENVLVEFYAPWCQHCQKFAPVYDKLAKIIAENNYAVSVYKIDAVGNDLRDIVDIPGFPTLLFYGQGAKDSPVDFRGHGRLTETDVLKFVLQEINNAAKKEYKVNNNKDEL